ncbi:MAG: minor capsid protein [Spirochaetia bacterium]|nr:minor capsid protein [Spirochaetia bacterium]
MSRPIPVKMLMHNAVLLHKSSIDRDRNAAYTEHQLEHVRVFPVSRTLRTSTGETKADAVTLFIDRVNSVYTLPEELDIVRFGRKEFAVREVVPYYTQGDDTVHHWEVILE